MGKVGAKRIGWVNEQQEEQELGRERERERREERGEKERESERQRPTRAEEAYSYGGVLRTGMETYESVWKRMKGWERGNAGWTQAG